MREPLPILFCNVMWYLTKPHCKFLMKWKRSMVLRHMEKELKPVLDKYKDLEYKLPDAPSVPKRVWLLWYSPDNRTEMVDLYLRRIESSLGSLGFEVSILDKDTLWDYVDMSDIQPYYEQGAIRIQHYADILRMRLLRKYGGFWVDATYAVLDPSVFLDIVRDVPFCSLREKTRHPWRLAMAGRWAPSFWATCPANPFFRYVDEAMTYYLKKHGGFFEYFQMDYSIAVGYRHVGFIRYELDTLLEYYPEEVKDLELRFCLNEPFDEAKFEEIKRDFPLQKTTHKHFVPVMEKDGKETFYAYLVHLWSGGGVAPLTRYEAFTERGAA